MNVEVLPVRNRGTLVDVPIVLHGVPIHCAFFVDNVSMRLVRIFGDKSSQGRRVPVEAIREARQRAFDALAELEPQTERTTQFDFVVDIAAQAFQFGV